MKEYRDSHFEGERSLFMSEDVAVIDSTFTSGESPLKESRRIRVDGCTFDWKYPLWYCDGVTCRNTTLTETARSGIWYTKNITMSRCNINAPKTFRRAEGIFLRSVRMPNALETMWSCRDIHLYDVYVEGDYFGMNCVDVLADSLTINGNYAFDGGMNIIIRNSTLLSKDAFWNCENVIVENSTIVGEYLGWNSSNVRFINCKIESNQGLCYMKNVVLEDCELINTDLAFEYSTVNAEVKSHVISIKNPSGGRISVNSVGEIIIDENRRGEDTAIEVGGTDVTL